jgi:hypothetical protein
MCLKSKILKTVFFSFNPIWRSFLFLSKHSLQLTQKPVYVKKSTAWQLQCPCSFAPLQPRSTLEVWTTLLRYQAS